MSRQITEDEEVLLEWGIEAMEAALYWLPPSCEVTIDKLEKCIARYKSVLGILGNTRKE